MQGNMMPSPMTLTRVMTHAKTVYPDQEIVSVTSDNPLHRYTFRESFDRVAQLSHALRALGGEKGDRIGTLAWNDYRHFELYYATSCSGLVCHTINPRLFAEHIEFIINHAEDRFIFTDPMFVPLLESFADKLNVDAFIVLTDADNMPETALKNVYCYEALISNYEKHFEWPALDENDACALCYTSGTTGNPKGVIYSHRAMVMHAQAAIAPDIFNLSYQDIILPIVPMFHVNAWSIPYCAAAVGAKLVFPGAKMADGEALTTLINREKVTCSAGVPTVWLSLLNYLREKQLTVPTLNRVVSGGSACPWRIMSEFEEVHGVYTHHAWGMTEMSPLGSFNAQVPSDLSAEEAKARRLKQGRPCLGVELRIVDDNQKELARDGEAFGALQVRGPWVCERYFKQEESALTADGWFDTGDVATLDSLGFMTITDRTKDVIKSGGEWIPSIELENHAMAFDGVAEAAVIGVIHPKWGERPLLVVVKEEGAEIDSEVVLTSFSGKVASWWIPSDCVFTHEIPHTATGKVSKKDLRVQFEGHQWS